METGSNLQLLCVGDTVAYLGRSLSWGDGWQWGWRVYTVERVEYGKYRTLLRVDLAREDRRTDGSRIVVRVTVRPSYTTPVLSPVTPEILALIARDDAYVAAQERAQALIRRLRVHMDTPERLASPEVEQHCEALLRALPQVPAP